MSDEDTIETHEDQAPESDPETKPTPVPLMAFVGKISKTPDAVFGKLLHQRHGSEKHTNDEWHGLLDKLRDEPAYPKPHTLIKGA